MDIVYRPKDGEEKVWEVDIEDLDLEELGLIERYSGKSYEQIALAFTSGRGVFSILRSLIFVYLRREDPETQYRNVKPKMKEIKIRPGLDDLLELQEKVLADPKYPNREAMLAELEDDIAEAKARGGSGKDDSSPTPEPSPAAPSRRRGKSTGPSST